MPKFAEGARAKIGVEGSGAGAAVDMSPKTKCAAAGEPGAGGGGGGGGCGGAGVGTSTGGGDAPTAGAGGGATAGDSALSAAAVGCDAVKPCVKPEVFLVTLQVSYKDDDMPTTRTCVLEVPVDKHGVFVRAVERSFLGADEEDGDGFEIFSDEDEDQDSEEGVSEDPRDRDAVRAERVRLNLVKEATDVAYPFVELLRAIRAEQWAVPQVLELYRTKDELLFNFSFCEPQKVVKPRLRDALASFQRACDMAEPSHAFFRAMKHACHDMTAYKGGLVDNLGAYTVSPVLVPLVVIFREEERDE